MERFGYVRAESIADAVTRLNTPGMTSRVLAGGTDLMLILRETRAWPDRVVDITQVAEMRRIELADGCVTIGAGTTFAELIESPIIAETAPLLLQAGRQVGATQVRNVATLGGNIVNAAACADSLPALVCLNATLHLHSPDGERSIPLSDFIVGPNRTSLAPGVLLVAITYRIPAPRSSSVFLKLGRRNAMAISRLTVAALGRVDATNCIVDCRIVPGSATPRVQRLEAVEKSLLGQEPTQELMIEAGRLAVHEVAKLAGQRWSSAYKEPALQSLVTRALRAVFGQQPRPRGSER